MALANYRARTALAVLVVVAMWETAVLYHVKESAPTSEDWSAAAAAVAASGESEGLILFAPRWIDPVGRLWLGDRISLDDAARMDTVRYRQVWEISTRGATAPEVAHEIPVSDRTFGRLRVRQFQRAAPVVTWDLRDRSRIHEVDFEPRKGVVLELHHAEEKQRLFFQAVSLGEELQVFAGLAGYRTRAENRATALLQGLVDGRELTRGYIGNDSGWLPLPVAFTAPGPHDVELVASVHESHGAIHLVLCVAAESRIRR